MLCIQYCLEFLVAFGPPGFWYQSRYLSSPLLLVLLVCGHGLALHSLNGWKPGTRTHGNSLTYHKNSGCNRQTLLLDPEKQFFFEGSHLIQDIDNLHRKRTDEKLVSDSMMGCGMSSAPGLRYQASQEHLLVRNSHAARR